MKNGRLVSTKVAGYYLGVTDRCIRRYACDGLIKKYYIEGSSRYYLVSLDELDGVEYKIDQRIQAQHKWAKEYGKRRYAEHGMSIFKNQTVA
jgi:hypothetical protein